MKFLESNLLRAPVLVVLFSVNLFWAYSSLGASLDMEEAMTQPLEQLQDTKLIWEYILLTPGADIFDRDQLMVQAMIRYALVENDVKLLTEMGVAYVENPEYTDEAEDFFYDAIEMSPKLGVAPVCPHYGLGTIFMQKGDVGAAVEQWELFVQNSELTGIEGEFSYKTRWILSVYHYDQGNTDKALHYLKTFISMTDTEDIRTTAYALWAALHVQQEPDDSG